MLDVLKSPILSGVLNLLHIDWISMLIRINWKVEDIKFMTSPDALPINRIS